MARGVLSAVAAATACIAACAPAWCGRLYGEVTSVTENAITTSFPAAVKPGSAMIVMSGDGESVAGMAISQYCRGRGPYEVSGAISWVSDPMNFKTGKKVYVNSLNASAIPAKKPAPPRARPTPLDLGVYYYSSAQKVGYGALGLGLEKSLNLGTGASLELDGGITGLAAVGADNGGSFETSSLLKSLNGRLNLNLAPGCAFYSGYRWSKGKGTDEHWDIITKDLQGKTFAAASSEESGVVALRGLEYGLALHVSPTASLSVGYIPALRTDFGGLGVLCEPARTAELRFGDPRGGIRIRGLSGEDYWLADLGITISR